MKLLRAGSDDLKRIEDRFPGARFVLLVAVQSSTEIDSFVSDASFFCLASNPPSLRRALLLKLLAVASASSSQSSSELSTCRPTSRPRVEVSSARRRRRAGSEPGAPTTPVVVADDDVLLRKRLASLLERSRASRSSRRRADQARGRSRWSGSGLTPTSCSSTSGCRRRVPAGAGAPPGVHAPGVAGDGHHHPVVVSEGTSNVRWSFARARAEVHLGTLEQSP